MHLFLRGTDNEQDRWGTGCDGVSTCQTHVNGWSGDLQTLLYVHSRMGGNFIHLLPPKNICIYICMAIYNIEVCTPVQNMFATNH